jgi:hypothetical protein
MDFILEEEMIDIITLCLQEPSSNLITEKKERFKEIGKELFESGGLDAMENFFFAVDNRIQGEINQDPKSFRLLWNGITDEWNYH